MAIRLAYLYEQVGNVENADKLRDSAVEMIIRQFGASVRQARNIVYGIVDRCDFVL